jgi:uncharacterized SAM-binding protein YcdF (DUF218 family)
MVIVVLGCAVKRVNVGADRSELAPGAARRRVEAAAAAYARGDAETVIASGGRAWRGIVEADALRDALVRAGVPEGRVVRERCSFNTRENARYVARLMRRRGEDDVELVTCHWHLPRAAALFRAEGLRVREVAAEGPEASWIERTWRWGRERIAMRLDGVAP